MNDGAEHRMVHLLEEAAMAVLSRRSQVGRIVHGHQRHTQPLGLLGGRHPRLVGNPLREAAAKSRHLFAGHGELQPVVVELVKPSGTPSNCLTASQWLRLVMYRYT